MPAAKLNLTIEQGATYKKKFTWKDSAGVAIDLSGYSARMHIRKSKASSDPPLVELTNTNGGIVLGGGCRHY